MQEDDDINLRLEREIQRDSLRESRSAVSTSAAVVATEQYGTNMTGVSAFEDENLLEE